MNLPATALKSPQLNADAAGKTSGGASNPLRAMAGGYAAQQHALAPSGRGYDQQLAALRPGGPPIQLRASGSGSGQGEAAAAASHAFGGAAGALPHLNAMEASFGRDLSHVEAFTGAGPAAACEALGADAMAAGSQVAFRDRNPAPHVVAHEVTHVLENSGGKAVRARNGNPARVDTSHEGTAEAVEAAVRSGGKASDVLEKHGLGPGSDDLQLLKSSISLSGSKGLPCTFGANSDGLFTGAVTQVPLWPRTVIPVPLSGGFFFQIVTQGGFQVTGGGKPDLSAASLGGRVRADLNFEVAGGTPFSNVSGGVGMRAQSKVAVKTDRSKRLALEAGALSFSGALIAAFNVGPHAALRLEWRALEVELLKLLWTRIDGNGMEGGVFECGEDLKNLAAFIEEVKVLGKRIKKGLKKPIRVVVEAGQSLEAALAGVAELADVMGCVGSQVGTGLAETFNGPTLSALYDEQVLKAMVEGGTEGPAAKGGEASTAAGSILGTLWAEFIADQPERNADTPINLTQLLSWHDRLQSFQVDSNADIAADLEVLNGKGIDAHKVGKQNPIDALWTLSRADLVAFAGDPNDVASTVVEPFAERADAGLEDARARREEACGTD